jgi:hypothetical protein
VFAAVKGPESRVAMPRSLALADMSARHPIDVISRRITHNA